MMFVIFLYLSVNDNGLAFFDTDLLSHVRRLRVPPLVFFVFMDGQVLAATPTEQRLVHLGHVLEEPFNIGPLAAELALLANFTALYPEKVSN